MDEHAIQPVSFMGAVKRCVRRLLAVGENRFELLLVEMQEESDRLLHMLILAIGAAVLGLLAAMGFSAAVVIALWDRSRMAAILILTAAYAIGAMILCWRLTALRRQQQTLPATLDQLRKDRACLEKSLS